MTAPRIFPLLAALVLTASADLLAQQQELPVGPGDRVRATAPTIDPGPLVGTLVALRADTIVLEVAGHDATLPLPTASLTKLEVSRGQKSRTAMGALLGFVGGGAIGFGVGSAVGGYDDVSGVQVAGIAGGASAVLGALVGAAIGGSSKVGMRRKCRSIACA